MLKCCLLGEKEAHGVYEFGIREQLRVVAEIECLHMDELSVLMNVVQHVESLVKVLGELDQINLCETTIIGFEDVLNGCEKLHSSDIVDFSHLRKRQCHIRPRQSHQTSSH